jgi:hypothetical protein
MESGRSGGNVSALCENSGALVGLHFVNVHKTQKTEIPRAGFEPGAGCDQEQGLGIPSLGQSMFSEAGIAMLLWITEKDNGAPIDGYRKRPNIASITAHFIRNIFREQSASTGRNSGQSFKVEGS